MPPCYALFTMTSTSEVSNLEYSNLLGVNQALTSKLVKEAFFVELTFEEVDWNVLQLAMGELAAKTDDVPFYEELTLSPLTSTTVNDSRIDNTLTDSVAAYNATDRNFMIQATAASEVDNNIYFVDGPGQNLIFSADNLGDIIEVKVPVLKDDIACIGGFSDRGEFYDISFQGSFLTTAGDGPYTINIPNLRRVSAPTLTAAGETVVASINFQAVSGDLEDYERKPFRIYSSTSFIPIAEFYIQLEDEGLIQYEDEGAVLSE